MNAVIMVLLAILTLTVVTLLSFTVTHLGELKAQLETLISLMRKIREEDSQGGAE